MTRAELRLYTPDECGPDGYPIAWHKVVKHEVRARAEHRCERCRHPYPPGIAKTCPKGEWTPCDDLCTHKGPLRAVVSSGTEFTIADLAEARHYVRQAPEGAKVEARYRILTVHHLDGDKANLRWWNLVALCQRCHLEIQGRVRMAQVYPFEHSPWFRPYAAGFYAFAYLGLELTREETLERLDELLALERAV